LPRRYFYRIANLEGLRCHNLESGKKMSFGIFYELELKAKGHPLSRISRSF